MCEPSQWTQAVLAQAAVTSAPPHTALVPVPLQPITSPQGQMAQAHEDMWLEKEF